MASTANEQTTANGFHSQHGEDLILSRIFAGAAARTCVEVGAHNGIDLSNTYYFEQLGWRCILVEPNPLMCSAIREIRNAVLFECAASGQAGEAILHVGVGGGTDVYSSMEAVGVERIKQRGAQIREVTVKTRRLDDMLEECEAKDVAFVSIDVEGHELDVLEGLTLERWKPQLIVVEDDSTLNPGVSEFMVARGYTRFFRTGGNDWYAAPGTLDMATFQHLLVCRLSDLAKGLIKTWLPGVTRFLLAIKHRVERFTGPPRD